MRNHEVKSGRVFDVSDNVFSIVSATTVCDSYGDVNLDGTVNIFDVILVNQYIANLTTLTEEQLLRADVDQDGSVVSTDATYILEFVTGTRSSFPACEKIPPLTSFNPSQVSLLAIGESTTITVETVDMDPDVTGVQINIQHSTNVSVWTPTCTGIFLNPPAFTFLTPLAPVSGGTLIGCVIVGGSGTVSGPTGGVMTFTLTRVGDFDLEAVTFLIGDPKVNPQVTNFSSGGIPILPGRTNELNVFSVPLR